MFNGGTDAAIIPHGAIPWQGQTRILFDWKSPLDLQSVESVVTQAQLELMGALHNSQHPALVVFTDGVNFVILQPWGHAIQYYHTFFGTDDCISVNDAMRLIAHHLFQRWCIQPPSACARKLRVVHGTCSTIGCKKGTRLG